jgi:hypothetical protein
LAADFCVLLQKIGLQINNEVLRDTAPKVGTHQPKQRGGLPMTLKAFSPRISHFFITDFTEFQI